MLKEFIADNNDTKKASEWSSILTAHFEYMRCFARLGTIGTNLKNVKKTHGGMLLSVKLPNGIKSRKRIFITSSHIVELDKRFHCGNLRKSLPYL